MTPLFSTMLWVGVLTLTAASLCLAVLAWRTKRDACTVASATLLLVAPAAVAVVVALKSVGRSTELDAAETRERFIIGTLVSLIWACSCAALVVLLR